MASHNEKDTHATSLKIHTPSHTYTHTHTPTYKNTHIPIHMQMHMHRLMYSYNKNSSLSCYQESITIYSCLALKKAFAPSQSACHPSILARSLVPFQNVLSLRQKHQNFHRRVAYRQKTKSRIIMLVLILLNTRQGYRTLNFDILYKHQSQMAHNQTLRIITWL